MYHRSFQLILSVVFALVLVVSGTSALAGILTGPVSNPSNGHDYYLLTNQNWTDSEAEAVSLGGHLVTISDQAENDWVMSTFGNYGGERRHLWVGFSDAAVEGTWTWSSGESVTFTNWLPGNPDNTNNEDYAYMIPDTGLWNDGQNGLFGGGPAPQGTSIFGVVEVVPEPVSMALMGLGALTIIHRCRQA